MAFYNKVILIGSLTENPDVRYTPSGSQVSRLSLRIDRDKGSERSFNPQIVEVIVLERDPPERSQSFSKGCWVLVEGKIQTRSWETLEGQKRSKVEIIGERIYPLGKQVPKRS